MTVQFFPWLRELGEAPLGEALREADQPLERDPLEYRSLASDHPLALVATSHRGMAAAGDALADAAGQLWARRAVYRLAGHPILVQEVFLPALLHTKRHSWPIEP
jgi:chorismate--pyruvate lyase